MAHLYECGRCGKVDSYEERPERLPRCSYCSMRDAERQRAPMTLRDAERVVARAILTVEAGGFTVWGWDDGSIMIGTPDGDKDGWVQTVGLGPRDPRDVEEKAASD